MSDPRLTSKLKISTSGKLSSVPIKSKKAGVDTKTIVHNTTNLTASGTTD